nr:DUF4143 domain-containing protein [Corynebacterium hadale]
MPRTIDQELDELLPFAPAIAIDGPKGVGKTDTALRRAEHVYRLDNPEQREVLAASFDLSAIPSGTTLLDEWQHLPQIWDSVRRAVDDGAAPGHFLLTGSATPVDAAGTHSGAGRILSLRMRPMGLHERGITQPTVSFASLLRGAAQPSGQSSFALPDYASAIAGSGFPAITQSPPRAQRAYLDSYLHRIIDRDVPEQGGPARSPVQLRAWLAAYAAATSTTTSYSRLLDATTAGDGRQPTKYLTSMYREHLTQLWLLDPVPGWLPTRNPLKRLTQGPKHHLADPGLAMRLLELDADDLLTETGAYMFGPLFESLVTLGVRTLAQANEAHVHHLRTKSGDREVDLIVTGSGGRLLALEVKLAASISDSDVRHLHWLREQLGGKVSELAVITTGQYAYRRPDGVAVIPLSLLGP